MALYISNGVINSGTQLGGEMYIYSGGSATSTTVKYGGSMRISSGGSATSTTVNWGGKMTVYGGGSATSTTVKDGGDIWVSSGGCATATMVNAGGIINGFTVSEDQYLDSGLHVSNAYVNRDAYLYAGQTATSTTVNLRGDMKISSGGCATSTTVNSGGRMIISSDGRVTATTVNSGGSMEISSGGSATATVVNSSGSMWVSSGVSATATVVNSGGSMWFASGGSATSTTVNSGGRMTISSGCITSTTVNAGGKINGFSFSEDRYFDSGLHVSNAYVNDGVDLYNGQTATSTTVNSGGIMRVSSGGSATATVVNSCGYIWVDSGGSIASTKVKAGGFINGFSFSEDRYFDSGLHVSNAYVHGRAYLYASQTATSMVLDASSMWVSSGGSATSTTMLTGGFMGISSGGSATATVVNSGGKMTVYDGGSATSTKVKAGGGINGFTVQEDNYYDSGIHISNAYVTVGAYACLYAGQTATSTRVNSRKSMVVSSGGGAISTTVDSGGYMEIYDGDSATSTTVNSGGTINGFIVREDNYYDSGIHISNAYVNSGTYAYLYAGQTATSTRVDVCSYMTIYDGGSATSTRVPGGWIFVSSGGSITTTSMYFGGNMWVFSGGCATSTMVDGGNMWVYDWGSATSTTVNSGSYMWVGAGCTTSTTVNGGRMVVEGSATSTTVNRGKMTVSSGGCVTATTMNSGGSMQVDYSGSATSTTVNSGGYMRVYDCGSATATMVNSGGYMTVGGGSVTSTTVNSGGYMWVGAGSTTSTTVNSGGSMYVYGYATSTTVNSGGRMYVSSGGYVNNLQIAEGAEVVLRSSSRLDFRIVDQLSTADVLVNDWSLIVDEGASYTITVGQDQRNGVYQLAGGAANFNKDITITVDGIGTIGTFTDSSNVITSGDYTYTLSKTESGTLTLTVQGGLEPPEVPLGNPVIAGGNAIQIMADGTVKIHTAGDVASPGRIDPNAWTLLDSGDFNRDGKDGLLWLEKATGNVYMQDDLSSMTEVTNKSKLLGVAGGGYEVQAAGDFFGTGFEGALLLGPAFGNESLNYGLATWSREQDGSTTPGWLGALVNTWEESGPLNSLKGDFQNLTGDARNEVINKNNYQYEFVGVGDFNGDGIDDVILRNTMPDTVGGETITGAGDVFVFLTDTRENVIAGNRPAEGIVYTGCATDGWDVVGIGDFNGDGIDDVVISNGTDLAGWQVSNGQRTEDLWFGSLTDGWKFAGVGDFDADGTDDILLADPDNNLAAWKVKDGQTAGIITLA